MEIPPNASTAHSGIWADLSARAIRWLSLPQAFCRARSSSIRSANLQTWTTHSIGMPIIRARNLVASSDLPSSARRPSIVTTAAADSRHISANLVSRTHLAMARSRRACSPGALWTTGC
uniref:Uncharacterized protein n=1 Tax=Streptomyces sp. HK1 TaxID=405041 RepID=B0LUA7_9ACTN|nr:unknown [Streptomyces sp. HK1]